MSQTMAKIKPINSLAKIIAEHKNKGKRIVQCHGVFDLVHLGHIRHFNLAKKEGDILIIRGDGTFAITVKDGTGAGAFILAGGLDFVMDHVDDRLWVINNGTEWVELSRSSNS